MLSRARPVPLRPWSPAQSLTPVFLCSPANIKPPVPSVESLLLGFGVGPTGALAPGPTLLATISWAVRNGPLVGARVAAGHLLAVARATGISPLVISHGAGIVYVVERPSSPSASSPSGGPHREPRTVRRE